MRSVPDLSGFVAVPPGVSTRTGFHLDPVQTAVALKEPLDLSNVGIVLEVTAKYRPVAGVPRHTGTCGEQALLCSLGLELLRTTEMETGSAVVKKRRRADCCWQPNHARVRGRTDCGTAGRASRHVPAAGWSLLSPPSLQCLWCLKFWAGSPPFWLQRPSAAGGFIWDWSKLAACGAARGQKPAACGAGCCMPVLLVPSCCLKRPSQIALAGKPAYPRSLRLNCGCMAAS